MDASKGYIYILTNPSFEDYIKIGYADNVERRLQQLNNSECTPFAFRVYATYEVDSRLSDLKIHAIIDKLNPNLRSIDNFNGKKRVREFYAMSKEDAYDILEAIAEIHNRTDKLILWDISDEDKRAEAVAEEVRTERRRSAVFSFDFADIPDGAELVCADDPAIVCTVADRRRVIYQGELIYPTSLARRLSGTERLMAGPGWLADHFTYEGETIRSRINRLERWEGHYPVKD